MGRGKKIKKNQQQSQQLTQQMTRKPIKNRKWVLLSFVTPHRSHPDVGKVLLVSKNILNKLELFLGYTSLTR